MPLDVVCAGLIVADHVCAPIPRFPPQGGLVMTDRLELTIGGCAANVAVDLARLDLAVSVGGRVGDDVLGRFVTESLASQGVSCETITRSRTAQTSATLVVNVAGEDRRFLHAVGANAEFTGDELSEAVLRTCRAVYVGGFGLNPALSGASVARLFRTAREAGAITLLDVVVGDPALLPPMLAEALPETDVFLPNEDEALAITGVTGPLEQARLFRDLGAGTVVVTSGSRGSLLLNRTGGWRAEAYQTPCVDGTGGGDAFAAGFLYGQLQGGDPVRCLQYGAAMGSSCVRAMGATTGVFRRGELEAFVSEQVLNVRPL